MRIALPALACALAQPLFPQQVFVVDQAGGPGVYTDIWLALAAGADDGDVILVREGTYGNFEIQGQGVSIVADAGATPNLAYAYDNGLRISGLDPDDAVVLRGLAFTMLTLTGGADTLLDVSAGGAVLIEDCTFTDGRPSLRVRPGARVALERCVVEGIDGAWETFWWGSWGPGNGIIVEGEVSVGDSSVSGGRGNDTSYHVSMLPATSGADAIFVMGAGVLNVRNSRLEGGVGGDGGYEFGCFAPGTGGAGLHLYTGAPVARLVGTTLVGGLPGDPVGAPYFCPPSVPGPGLLQDAGTVEGLAEPAPQLAVDGVVREGQTLQGTVTGEPGALALLGIGAAPAPVYLPALHGVLLVGPPLQAIVLGTIPASGVLPLAALVGELGPGISAAQLMLQAATCASGGCALGAGSAAVLLDAAY